MARSDIPKLAAYPASHPVAIALTAIGRAMTVGVDVVRSLDEQARNADVMPGCESYDDAAELTGFPYCRGLDLYVPKATRDRADALHFTEAHPALT